MRFLITVIILVISITLNGSFAFAQEINMDVKCTVYEHSDDINGNNVDVRILVMGLKDSSDYTANVLPDHNPPTKVTIKSDSDGTFWVVAKVPNGEKSILFNVKVYEGNGTEGSPVASGDDDAPCYNIPFRVSSSSSSNSSQ